MQSEAVESVEEIRCQIRISQDISCNFDLNRNEIKDDQPLISAEEVVEPVQKNNKEKLGKRRRVINLAQSLVLELNRGKFRLKENLQSRVRPEIDSNNHLAKMPKKGRHRHALNEDLFSQISSLVVTPVDGGSMLMSSRKSAPDLLAYRMSFRLNTSLLDLDDNLLHRILQYADGNSVHAASQSCRRLQRIAHDNNSTLQRKTARSYELVIERNNHTGKVDVKASKLHRSISDPKFESNSLRSILPATMHCFTKITFGPGVNVMDWASELVKLHHERRLTPTALIFAGGSRHSGADLRGFSEADFVSFVSQFYPHIQEVQLATNRLFKTSTSPPYLLSLISILSFFGVIYERPALRYNFEEIKHIIKHWQTQELSENCEVFIRRPSGACRRSWTSLGAIIEGESNRIHRAIVPHSFHRGVELILNLH